MSDSAQSPPKPKMSTDIPVGEILRRTRVHYKQSFQDIEIALRIRASQIEAIEQGDLSRLPAKVYAIGFVRSYSEFLGLDGDKMVELFKSQTAGHTPGPELHFPAATDETPTPSLWLVGGGFFVVLILLAIWMGRSGSERSEMETIPEPPQAQVAPAPTVSQPPSPETEQAIEMGQADLNESTSESSVAAIDGGDPQPVIQEETLAEKPKEGIILKILANSWVEIKDRTGKTVLSRVLQEGDEYFVPDRPDLTISLGNAGGVQFEVDGQELRLLGEPGQVRRSLPLDAAYLKKNFAL